MIRYTITFTIIALLLMNFQCEPAEHTPLTIVTMDLAAICRLEQTNFKSSLYLSTLEGFTFADEKTSNIDETLVFQYTSIWSGYIKLESTKENNCRSSWYKIEPGKRQSILLAYSRDQPIIINLASQPSTTIDSFSIQIYRMFEDEVLSGDDDEWSETGLAIEDFPLTNIVLSTSSSYRILLYEHRGQAKFRIATKMIETGPDGNLIEVGI